MLVIDNCVSKNSKATSYQFILATVMLVLVIIASPYQFILSIHISDVGDIYVSKNSKVTSYQFILSNHSDQVDVGVQLQDRGIVFTPSIKALQDKDDKDI